MSSSSSSSDSKLRSGGEVVEATAGSCEVGWTGTAEGLSKELHPLLNPVILANLFQVCPHETLSNCRLVSKTWYHNSLLPWRSSSTLAFKYSRNKNQIYLAIREDLEKRVMLVSSGSDSSSGSDDDESEASQNYKTEKDARISLRQFLDFSERECSVKPYRQFHLNFWPFGGNALSNSNQEQQGRFWNVVGRNVTLLKLSKCKFGDATEFRRIVFQTCPKLRSLVLDKCIFASRMPHPETAPVRYMEPVCGEQVNLKSLSLFKIYGSSPYRYEDTTDEDDEDEDSNDEDGQDVEDDEGDESDPDNDDNGGNAKPRVRNFPIPISYLELLSHFPSLNTLNIFLDYYVKVDDLLLLLHAIKVIRRRDGRKLPIKEFHIGPQGLVLTAGFEQVKSNQIFSLFQELNLSLEYLVIDFSAKVDVLKDLLTLVGSNIRKIKAMKRPSSYGPVRLPAHRYPLSRAFPCCGFPFGVELTNLQTLILSSTFVKNVEFLKWTPNLGKLHLATSDDQNRQSCVTSKIISNTSEANMAGVELPKLNELFLGYSFTEDDLGKLCKWMPNVEILSMFLYDDQFIIICEHWRKLTHIHELGGKQLHDEAVTGMGWGPLPNEDGSVEEKIQPNITMLKDLYCFQYAPESKCNLTDLSVYNGFLKLPNLHILNISSEKDLISDEAVKALRKQIPNCRVRARDSRRGAWFPGTNSGIGAREDECKYFTVAKPRY